MRYAGVWLALIPACLGALALCIQEALIVAGHGTFVGGLNPYLIGGLGIEGIIIPATPGVLLWIAGWIVEGFAKGTD